MNLYLSDQILEEGFVQFVDVYRLTLRNGSAHLGENRLQNLAIISIKKLKIHLFDEIIICVLDRYYAIVHALIDTYLKNDHFQILSEHLERQLIKAVNRGKK